MMSGPRQWDDSTRTYTEWDLDGNIVEQRPYNADENTVADANASLAAAQAAREADRATVKQIIADLQAEKARVQVVLDKQNSALVLSDVKDVARAARRIADAAIDLARFVKDS